MDTLNDSFVVYYPFSGSGWIIPEMAWAIWQEQNLGKAKIQFITMKNGCYRGGRAYFFVLW